MSFKPKEVLSEYVSDTQLPSNDLVGIVDTDFVKYAVASAGEKRTLKVTSVKTGKEVLNTVVIDGKKTKVPFKTRTEFWGRKKNTIEGWLGELNAKREKEGKKPFTKDYFLIEDIQTPDKLENVLHSAKLNVYKALRAVGVGSAENFIGEGDSFRVNLSTLQEYKGNRTGIKPLYLQEVTDYLKTKFSCTVVKGIEADDAVVIRAYEDDNAIIIGEDKDYRGQPVNFFDVNNPEEGVINGDCFGKLWIKGSKTNKKVTGYGRLFLYWQMLSEDKVDNYKANCFSDTSWAAMSAYDALVSCENDGEALNSIICCFKKLYPEPKYIESWNGNTILIDWYYVVNEMFQMARMQRWVGDVMTFDSWCAQYGVKF